MLNQFLRTQRLFHREDMEKLYQGRAAGGGIGGVGEFGLIDDGRGLTGRSCKELCGEHFNERDYFK